MDLITYVTDRKGHDMRFSQAAEGTRLGAISSSLRRVSRKR